MAEYKIRELCGDWALDIPMGNDIVVLYFNSRVNAEMVKNVLEWENAHPNEAIPYNTPAIDPESLRPEWVSVKDRLPEENKDVLVFTELGKMAVAFYEGGIYWYLYIGDNGEGGYELNGEKITHWAQLPKPPEGFEYREGWLPIAHYTYHGAQRFEAAGRFEPGAPLREVCVHTKKQLCGGCETETRPKASARTPAWAIRA